MRRTLTTSLVALALAGAATAEKGSSVRTALLTWLHVRARVRVDRSIGPSVGRSVRGGRQAGQAGGRGKERHARLYVARSAPAGVRGGGPRCVAAAATTSRLGLAAPAAPGAHPID